MFSSLYDCCREVFPGVKLVVCDCHVLRSVDDYILKKVPSSEPEQARRLRWRFKQVMFASLDAAVLEQAARQGKAELVVREFAAAQYSDFLQWLQVQQYPQAIYEYFRKRGFQNGADLAAA